MSLFITNLIEQRIKALVAHAENNPFSMDDLLDIVNGHGKPAGDYPEFTIEIPSGYKVVYSIEEQPIGTVRHLSVSVDGKVPNPNHTSVVMDLFGFKSKLGQNDSFVHIEKLPMGMEAINILELIQ